RPAVCGIRVNTDSVVEPCNVNVAEGNVHVVRSVNVDTAHIRNKFGTLDCNRTCMANRTAITHRGSHALYDVAAARDGDVFYVRFKLTPGIDQHPVGIATRRRRDVSVHRETPTLPDIVRNAPG